MESVEPLRLSEVDAAFGKGMIQIEEEIRAFAEFLKPLRLWNCLEIGSENGGSFYLWCRIFRGFKISIDLPSGASGSGTYTDAQALAERKQRMLSWAPNVRVITGDSHRPETKSKLAAILGHDRLGLLFIDGDHTYEGVKQDFEMYKEFVSPGGYIAFHDINDSEYHRKRGCFVGQLWGELDGDKREFNAGQDWGGIGVLRA